MSIAIISARLQAGIEAEIERRGRLKPAPRIEVAPVANDDAWVITSQRGGEPARRLTFGGTILMQLGAQTIAEIVARRLEQPRRRA